MSDTPSATVTTQQREGSTVIGLCGTLNASTLGPPWTSATQAARDAAGPIKVDASKLTACDGAGLALLVEIAVIARGKGTPATFEGLSEDLRSLLDRAMPGNEAAPRPTGANPVERLGRFAGSFLEDLAMIVAFLGEITVAFGWAIGHPARVRWRDALLVAEKAGANATPVVALLGWLMGLIISFQSANPLQQLGADSMIPTLLAIAMVRELGPLVTAIVLAGRSGSAFAAELGTMKVTEEINALTTFGLEPVRFLVVPRLIAAMAMTPLLSVFGTLFGLLGGYVVVASLGYSLPFYITQVQGAVDWVDFVQGMFKSIVFAFLVTAIGCVRGLQTGNGPGAVGDSTTRAVVAGIVLVVAADGVMGVCFYYLGI